MTTCIEIQSDGAPIKYAWPGGYPVFYFARTGYRNDAGELEASDHDSDEAICCADCAAKALSKEIILTNNAINWEYDSLFCEFCSQRIESAYGDE